MSTWRGLFEPSASHTWLLREVFHELRRHGIRMDEKEQIEECYRRMYEGMVKKDEAILREVLAPSFVLIHMTGMLQPLDEFIRAVQDGTLNYSSAQHQNIMVQFYNDHVELIGQSLVRAAVFGGGWHTWRLQLRCQAVRSDGKWQITQARASTY